MIVLGRIVAPFGIKGWVKVVPYGDDHGDWVDMPRWWLARTQDAPEGDWKPVDLIECREHGSGLIASLAEVPDRTAAENLQGWFVAAPREALPEPDNDEFYWADLIGLAVENHRGESLGNVAGLISTGAHDVLRVLEDETERLIPFVKAYALDVDLEAKLIRVEWEKDW